MTLREAMLAKDWEFAASYLRERYGVDVSAGQIEESGKKTIHDNDRWSDGTWDLWLRKRVDCLNAWPPALGNTPDLSFKPVELHAFFISIAETEEMLAKLRKEKVVADTDNPARSKLSKTNEVIHPIDSVAAKVAPEPT